MTGPCGHRNIQRAAREAGLAWRTLERAKHRLGVEATRIGYGTTGQWYWRLPKPATDTEPATKTAREEDVAVFEPAPVNPPLFSPVTPKTATHDLVAVSEATTGTDEVPRERVRF